MGDLCGLKAPQAWPTPYTTTLFRPPLLTAAHGLLQRSSPSRHRVLSKTPDGTDKASDVGTFRSACQVGFSAVEGLGSWNLIPQNGPSVVTGLSLPFESFYGPNEGLTHHPLLQADDPRRKRRADDHYDITVQSVTPPTHYHGSA